MNSNNATIKKITGCLLFLVSVGLLIMMALQTGTDDIWYDEVFSVGFMGSSYKDMIAYTARDVHPPFYYIFLRIGVKIITLIPGVSIVTAAKLSSMIPALVCLIIAATYIRKKWGDFTMGLFAFLLTAMPQLANYYVEIRMYSLALLILTASGLLAYSIAADGGSSLKWILFFIMGILSAYTQYYSCIGTVGIYIALFILIITGDKNSRVRLLINEIICAVFSVILYIPWLPSLLKQIRSVNSNYWIQPLTLRSIAGCVKFITLPSAPFAGACLLAAGLVIAVVGLIFAINIIRLRDRELAAVIITGLVPVGVIVASGFLLSVLGTPIFVYRYMIPALGLFWLMVAVLINRLINKNFLWLIIIIPFMYNGILSMRGFYLEEHKKVLFMEDTKKALDEIEADAVIICNFDHVASVMGYYLDNDIYLYNGDIDRLIPDMFHKAGTRIEDDGIIRLLNEGRTVYFFGSFNSRDDILKNFEEYGIANKEQASILFERYWFNIYRLRLE